METAYWVLLVIGAYAAMFVIVPPNEGPGLSPFGFWLGFVQALVILWVGQARLGLFVAIGDPTVLGIPILTSVLWIPPAILFAYYFRRIKTSFGRFGYVLFFAAGAAGVQYALELLDLWRNLRWNIIATFALAIATHSLMTAVLILRRKRV